MKGLAFKLLELLKRLPKLHALVLRVLRIAYKPYYSHQDAEFWHEHWVTTSLARCEKGRPLGEGAASPRHMVPAFDLVDRVGKLSGSRKGLPVNQSALQAVMRNWQPAVQVLQEIRVEYVRQRKLTTGHLNYVDLLCLTKVSSSLPAYLLRRNANSLEDGSIPEPIATIFKLTLGVRATVEAMINGGNQFNPCAVPNAHELYEYADSTGEFVSHRGAACGGPPGKVVDLFNVLITGEYESGDADRSAKNCLAVLNDLPGAVRYGIGTATMETVINHFKARATAIFVNDNLEEVARSCGKQEQYARIKSAAIDDSARGGHTNNYWREKVNTLGIFVQGQTRGKEFGLASVAVDEYPGRGRQDDVPASSFSTILRNAIANYDRLLDSGHAACIMIQREINQSLGIQQTGKFSRMDFAKRVNSRLYDDIRSMSPLS